MQLLVFVFLCALFFSILVCPSVYLSVLLCSGSCSLIKIKCMYVFYQFNQFSRYIKHISHWKSKKNIMKSNVLKLMNIVFYQSPQSSVATPNPSYSDQSLKAWKMTSLFRLVHTVFQYSVSHLSQYISYDYYIKDGLSVREVYLTWVLCVALMLFHIGWTWAPL